MGALARAVGEADKLLPALRRRADDNEDALRIVFQTRPQMNAVGPDVDVVLGGKVALVPTLVLVDPAPFRRAIVEADKPGASLPSKAASASSKSPVESSSSPIREKACGALWKR